MPGSIKSVAIYPPLGVARIGNSDEYFLASPMPGKAPVPENGFKDSLGKVKKQVCLFRVYGLDEDGNVVKEITVSDGAVINWRVQVANRKAAWYQFNNALDLGCQAIACNPRNPLVLPLVRNTLIIDPGPREISGINMQGPQYQFDGGKFLGMDVPLGEARTDNEGRLMFFGGWGVSAPRISGWAQTFANNDGWHDDISDGPVRATVTLDGTTYEAMPAMVAVTPPNFGPGLFGVVTMYDVVYDLYVRSGWVTPPATIEFWQHIYPILERTVNTQWVNSGFYMLFGKNSPCDFTDAALLEKLSDPGKENEALRNDILSRYRKGDNYDPEKIPPFYGDAFGDYINIPDVDLPLTQTQYAWLQLWADGNFITGSRRDASFEELTPGEQVEALTRAPLEECLGGPFHPGIELTWPLRNLIMWDKPFRLKILAEGASPKDNYGLQLTPETALGDGGPLDGSGPGSLTRWLGVPWQTDEASCLSGYDPSAYLTLPSFWAVRVPNSVLSADSYKRLSDAQLNIAQRLKHLDYREDWMRDLGSQYVIRINNMVARWSELGIITQHPLPPDSGHDFLPEQLWVESDRGPFEVDDITFKQVLIAECADPASHSEATEILIKVAAINDDANRNKRKRPLFKRHER